MNKTRTDSGIYYFIVSTYTEYYADGACGEYTTTAVDRSKPIPKRRNVPGYPEKPDEQAEPF